MADVIDIVYVPVELIDPNPWNPNEQDEQQAAATRESIAEFGFVEPLVVRPHPRVEGRWELIGGEHRTIEAAALGIERVPVVITDLDDVKAQRLTMILNETRGEHDIVKLGTLLASLSSTVDADELMRGLPWTSGELERLIAIGSADGWDQMDADAMAGAGTGDGPPPLPSYCVEFTGNRTKADFVRKAEALAEAWNVTVDKAIVRAVKQAVQTAEQ